MYTHEEVASLLVKLRDLLRKEGSYVKILFILDSEGKYIDLKKEEESAGNR